VAIIAGARSGTGKPATVEVHVTGQVGEQHDLAARRRTHQALGGEVDGGGQIRHGARHGQRVRRARERGAVGRERREQRGRGARRHHQHARAGGQAARALQQVTARALDGRLPRALPIWRRAHAERRVHHDGQLGAFGQPRRPRRARERERAEDDDERLQQE
jgi:hypothetical protein